MLVLLLLLAVKHWNEVAFLLLVGRCFDGRACAHIVSTYEPCPSLLKLDQALQSRMVSRGMRCLWIVCCVITSVEGEMSGRPVRVFRVVSRVVLRLYLPVLLPVVLLYR
jgi:hypothetical protein